MYTSVGVLCQVTGWGSTQYVSILFYNSQSERSTTLKLGLKIEKCAPKGLKGLTGTLKCSMVFKRAQKGSHQKSSNKKKSVYKLKNKGSTLLTGTNCAVQQGSLELKRTHRDLKGFIGIQRVSLENTKLIPIGVQTKICEQIEKGAPMSPSSGYNCKNWPIGA